MQLHKVNESITSYDELVAALQTGVQLELGVLPPYFTAMYSVKDQASPACRILRGVMMEEMLHLALDCNLLNAIGAHPKLAPPYLPHYPLPLPHYYIGFKAHLAPLSREVARDTFMTIEKPSWLTHGSHDAAPAQLKGWETLGQFYKGIIEGFKTVSQQMSNLFVSSEHDQYGPNSIYSNGGGALKRITCLDEAVAAITENMDQTQGYPGKEYQPFGPYGAEEPSHFRHFEMLAAGEVEIGKVWPMAPDVKPADMPEDVAAVSQLFNDCWGLFVRALNDTFAEPYAYNIYFTQAMWLMKKVFPELAVALMSTPLHAPCSDRGNAGPSFDYSDRSLDQTLAEARELLASPACRENWKPALETTVEVLGFMQTKTQRLHQKPPEHS